METTRPATIEPADAARDADTIATLVEAYRIFYGQRSDSDGAAAFVRERLARGDTQFLVARGPDGTVVGFAHLLFSLDTVGLSRIGILEDIYVTEAARGTGVGGALLDAAERFARDNGLTRLTLSTAHQNRTAQRLYLTHGYVPDQRFRSFNRFLTE